MDENRRRRSRVDTHFQAVFTPHDGQSVALISENISMKGLLARPDKNVTAGQEGRLRITLASDVAIDVDCIVLRSDATGVAIDFLPMDEESFLHLRNLVRYNAADADSIDGEFTIPVFDETPAKP
jgi:hypothetical protein